MFDSTSGKGYPLRDWLTSYPFMLVALDPYTNESSWVLEAAAEILDHYSPADIRVGWIVTADEEDCKKFLGPWHDRFLTFADPERKLVKELPIEQLPALVHIQSNGVVEVADGWQPKQWNDIAATVAAYLAWSKPLIPKPGNPSAFAGSPVDGLAD